MPIPSSWPSVCSACGGTLLDYKGGRRCSACGDEIRLSVPPPTVAEAQAYVERASDHLAHVLPAEALAGPLSLDQRLAIACLNEALKQRRLARARARAGGGG